MKFKTILLLVLSTSSLVFAEASSSAKPTTEKKKAVVQKKKKKSSQESTRAKVGQVPNTAFTINKILVSIQIFFCFFTLGILYIPKKILP